MTGARTQYGAISSLKVFRPGFIGVGVGTGVISEMGRVISYGVWLPFSENTQVCHLIPFFGTRAELHSTNLEMYHSFANEVFRGLDSAIY
jgi:hypothetical protein